MKKIFNWKIGLILIVLLAVFFRFYQLGAIPSGLTNDEAGVGWDAYSILLTGKDQWNQLMPLHFIAFGDYPAPILRYLTILPIYFFGLNSFSVRFPSALLGVLSVILVFFLAKKLFNEKIALFSSFLFTISPWAIGLSRVTIEPNVAMTFLLLGLFLYFLAKEKKFFLFFSMLSFVAVVYTYSAYVIFLPFVTLILLIWDRKYIFTNLKIYGISLLLFISLVIPNFSTKNITASVRFSQVGITNNINSIGLINTLNDERGACLKDLNPTICKIADNKIILFLSTLLKNYSSHFNFNLLYGNGSSTQFSILPERGLEYIFELAFLILGVITIAKNKDKKGYLLLALLFISPIPDSLTGDGHYGRASIMLPFLLTIEGIGLFYLIKLLSDINYFLIRKSFYLILVLVIFAGVTIFWINYVTYFKNNYSVFSQYGYEDLMRKVDSLKNSYDRIYISRHLNDAKQYIYYLFYTKYDPSRYQSKKDVSYSIAVDGWQSVDKIENIYFVQIPPTNSQLEKMSNINSLIISNPIDFSKLIKPVFVVKDRLGNIIFEAVKSSDLLEYNREQKLLGNKENV